LRLLLEVDRLGSITRAAESCSMSQPTASTHLRTLETAVGHRLVERAGRATRLTDAGRLLAQHAAVVVHALEEFEAELASLANAEAGSLVVASCDTFGTYVLPDVLGAFTRDRPRADVHVRIGSSGDVVRAVADRQAHLGIVGRMRRSERVIGEALLRDELVWIASPRTRAFSAADVPALTLVGTDGASSTRAFTERAVTRLGLHPARLIELDSVEAVKRAVRSQLGIALVSRLAVADELRRGELRQLPLRGATRTIEIVRVEGRRPTPLQQAFEDTLRRRCAEPHAAAVRPAIVAEA
jgi:molybdate transport repressor ModE-like protein